jgi:hypothetical protein
LIRVRKFALFVLKKLAKPLRQTVIITSIVNPILSIKNGKIAGGWEWTDISLTPPNKESIIPGHTKE